MPARTAAAGTEGAATQQPDASAPAPEAGTPERTAEAVIEVAAPHAKRDRRAPCDRKANPGPPVSAQCAHASDRTGQGRPSPERSPVEETRPYRRRRLRSGMLTRHRPGLRRDEPTARPSGQRTVHWPA